MGSLNKRDGSPSCSAGGRNTYIIKRHFIDSSLDITKIVSDDYGAWARAVCAVGPFTFELLNRCFGACFYADAVDRTFFRPPAICVRAVAVRCATRVCTAYAVPMTRSRWPARRFICGRSRLSRARPVRARSSLAAARSNVSIARTTRSRRAILGLRFRPSAGRDYAGAAGPRCQ